MSHHKLPVPIAIANFLLYSFTALGSSLAAEPNTAATGANNQLEVEHIAGHVVDVDGQPIAGATVVLRASEWIIHLDAAVTARDFGQELVLTQTRGDGRFSFDDYQWQGHRINVVAHKSGFAPSAVRWTGTPATIVLHRGASVSGRVVDNADQPVNDAEVRLWFSLTYEQNERQPPMPLGTFGAAAPDWAVANSAIKVSTRTDRQGNFRLDDMPADCWVVLVIENPSFQSQPVLIDLADGDPLYVPRVNGGVQVINGATVRLRTAIPLRITAVSQRGGPVELQWVAVSTEQPRTGLDPSSLRSRTTIDRNVATLSQVFPDRSPIFPGQNAWIVPANDARHVPTWIDLHVSGDEKSIEHRVTLSPGVLVRGRVVDDVSGEPVEGATIHFRPRSAAEQTEMEKQRWFTLWARSDGEGRFAMVVPPLDGTLRLRGRVDGYRMPSYADFDFSNPDDVERFDRPISPRLGQRLEEIEFRLRPSVRFVIEVIDADGNPAPGARWRATHFGSGSSAMRSGTADANGRFELKHLFDAIDVEFDQLPHWIDPSREDPQREYTELLHRRTNQIVVWDRSGRQSASAKIPRPELESGELSLTIQLSPAPVLIGQFIDVHTDAGVKDIQVSTSWKASLIRFATSDEEGRFRLEGLLPEVAMQFDFHGKWIRFPGDAHRLRGIFAPGEHRDLGQILVMDLSHLAESLQMPDVRGLPAEAAAERLLESLDKALAECEQVVKYGSSGRGGDDLRLVAGRISRAFGPKLVEVAKRQPGTQFEFDTLVAALRGTDMRDRGEWANEALKLLVDRHVNRPGAADVLPELLDVGDRRLYREILHKATDDNLRAAIAFRMASDTAGGLTGSLYRNETEEEFNEGIADAEYAWRLALTEFRDHQTRHIPIGTFVRSRLEERRTQLAAVPEFLQPRAQRVIQAIDRVLEQK